ncbi:MAG: hypothetical protein QM568_07515 [Microbacterium sp.]
MKREDIAREAIRRSSVRAAAASVAIENRSVPVGYVRTVRGGASARRPQANCLTNRVPGYGETPVDPEDLDASRQMTGWTDANR